MMIESAVLPIGSRLPAIRHLAADLGVAANTVARAYRGLEEAGLAAASGRRGTVVTNPREEVNRLDAGVLGETAERLALSARHRGLDLEAAVDQLRSAYRRLDLEER